MPVTTNRLATYHFPDNEDIGLFGKENKYAIYNGYVSTENYIGEFDHWPTYEEVGVKLGNIDKLSQPELPLLEQLSYITNNKAYRAKSEEIIASLIEIAPSLKWRRTGEKYREMEAEYDGHRVTLIYYVSECGSRAYLKYGPLCLNSHNVKVRALYEGLTGEKI